VERATHRVAEILYKAQSSGGAEPAAEAGGGSGDQGDVIDAEYTEEKRGE
jgi:hypothetical protein